MQHVYIVWRARPSHVKRECVRLSTHCDLIRLYQILVNDVTNTVYGCPQLTFPFYVQRSGPPDYSVYKSSSTVAKNKSFSIHLCTSLNLLCLMFLLSTEYLLCTYILCCLAPAGRGLDSPPHTTTCTCNSYS